ncbi:pirin family protein [Flammeovirga pacifica]|uniref:Pirin n=1 Tax=Flammeovirga pacifica TaxID=915059 RepID=A0A1S1YWJ5_FLAPC|nr:pirin family protein [Flammeovirga pacifica]OHX65391.1 pirin [Flammeovirga pacifica]
MKKIHQIVTIGAQWPTLDPFLFTAHHKEIYPKGNEDMSISASLEGRNIGSDFSSKDGWSMYHGRKIPGFPYHPHRGFETITVVEEGFADHSDSLGAYGRFGNGDVQWMTAGKGVQHSEMFPLLSTDNDNPLELFQIWLNLPAKSKMVDPDYRMLWSEDIPLIKENNDQVSIKVIAGNYKETIGVGTTKDSWASNSEHNVAVWKIHLKANTTYQLPATEEGTNRTVYFYRGDEVQVEDQLINENSCIHVNETEEITLRTNSSEAYFLILQGKPINEAVAQHGPFVMNTKEELQEAFNDYQRTEFGGWPWEAKEKVHDKSKGRFAVYPNGKIEEKLK